MGNQRKKQNLYEIKKIENLYFSFIKEEITILDFENIVLNSDWVEEELSSIEYADLISLNFEDKSAKYELRKILKNQLDYQNWGMNQLVKTMEFDKNPSKRLEWNRKYGDGEYPEFWKYWVFTENCYFHSECPINLTEREESINRTIAEENEKIISLYRNQFHSVFELKTSLDDFYRNNQLVFESFRQFYFNQSTSEYFHDNSNVDVRIGELNLKINKVAFVEKLENKKKTAHNNV